MIKEKEIPIHIREQMIELKSELKLLFGEKIQTIILYGSYATGNYKIDSDIDVLILIADKNTNNYYDQILSITTKYLLRHDLLISFIVRDINFYNEWKESIDLFKSVEAEGIEI